MIKRFLTNEDGATAIEYALIATLISVVVVGATMSIGTKLNAKFFGPLLAGFG